MKFIFENYKYDNEDKELTLNYSCGEHEFYHKIEFPLAEDINDLSEEQQKALDKSFLYTLIAEGINYYKAFVTDIVQTPPLTIEEVKFFNKFYYEGLGEFSYRNNVKVSKEIFSASDFQREIANPELPNRSIICVGGGKDSITSMEILSDIDAKLFAIITDKEHNIPMAIADTMEISDRDSIVLYRHLCPNLFELKDVYNGHVPITGCLSFIMTSASILYGFKNIILSNESSANVGNVECEGRMVNHQWSKSFEFENMFNSFIHNNLSSEINYFSFLRPLSELQIAKIFSNFEKYHKNFISCNRTFKINNREKRWCCECDKCRFVFLMLAPWMDNLEEIFGKNLLDDITQLEGYKELIGLREAKPFDCVGEFEEAILAFQLLKGTSYEHNAVVEAINEMIEYNAIDLNEFQDRFLKPSADHIIPKEFYDKLIKMINA